MPVSATRAFAGIRLHGARRAGVGGLHVLRLVDHQEVPGAGLEAIQVEARQGEARHHQIGGGGPGLEAVGVARPPRALVDVDAEGRGEARGLPGPVDDDRGGADDEARGRGAGGAARGPGAEEREDLHGLAEAHVVRQAGADAVAGEEGEPRDPAGLVGAEIAHEAGRLAHGGDAAASGDPVEERLPALGEDALGRVRLGGPGVRELEHGAVGDAAAVALQGAEDGEAGAGQGDGGLQRGSVDAGAAGVEEGSGCGGEPALRLLQGEGMLAHQEGDLGGEEDLAEPSAAGGQRLGVGDGRPAHAEADGAGAAGGGGEAGERGPRLAVLLGRARGALGVDEAVELVPVALLLAGGEEAIALGLGEQRRPLDEQLGGAEDRGLLGGHHRPVPRRDRPRPEPGPVLVLHGPRRDRPRASSAGSGTQASPSSTPSVRRSGRASDPDPPCRVDPPRQVPGRGDGRAEDRVLRVEAAPLGLVEGDDVLHAGHEPFAQLLRRPRLVERRALGGGGSEDLDEEAGEPADPPLRRPEPGRRCHLRRHPVELVDRQGRHPHERLIRPGPPRRRRRALRRERARREIERRQERPLAEPPQRLVDEGDHRRRRRRHEAGPVPLAPPEEQPAEGAEGERRGDGPAGDEDGPLADRAPAGREARQVPPQDGTGERHGVPVADDRHRHAEAGSRACPRGSTEAARGARSSRGAGPASAR